MKHLKTFENMYSKDKDKEIFDYNSNINDLWRPVIFNAQKFQNISFDLENNDTTKQKKSIVIAKNLRENQPIKYVINAELYKAGGDWEWPVMYFKIELKSNYGLIRDEYKENPEYIWDFEKDYKGLYKHYVMIPPVEAGNSLIKNDKGVWIAYTDETVNKENEKDVKIDDSDMKNAWSWLEKTIEDAVEKRHRMLD
jgi:hypothetical protein